MQEPRCTKTVDALKVRTYRIKTLVRFQYKDMPLCKRNRKCDVDNQRNYSILQHTYWTCPCSDEVHARPNFVQSLIYDLEDCRVFVNVRRLCRKKKQLINSSYSIVYFLRRKNYCEFVLKLERTLRVAFRSNI